MNYYKHCVDMAHMYKKAIVKMHDGESKEIELGEWEEYADSEGEQEKN